MPINLYAGDNRSGKSHSVVEFLVIPSLDQGRTVVTNIPLQPGIESEFLLLDDYPQGSIVTFDSREPIDSNGRFDDKFFMNHDRFPKGSVFVIDECWMYWRAGMRADQFSLDGQEFFTMHAHRAGEDGFTTEIALVTQDASQLCSFVRKLIKYTYYTTKLDMLGKKFAGQANYLTFKDDYSKGSKAKELTSSRFKYREEIWRYYKSHSQDSGAGAVELSSDKRNDFMHVVKRRMLWVVGFIIFAIWLTSNWLDDQTEKLTKGDKSGAAQTAVSGQANAKGKKRASTSSFALPNNEHLHIAGYVNSRGFKNYQFLTASGGHIDASALLRLGYGVRGRSDCHVSLTDPDQNTLDVYCFLDEVAEDES